MESVFLFACFRTFLINSFRSKLFPYLLFLFPFILHYLFPLYIPLICSILLFRFLLILLLYLLIAFILFLFYLLLLSPNLLPFPIHLFLLLCHLILNLQPLFYLSSLPILLNLLFLLFLLFLYLQHIFLKFASSSLFLPVPSPFSS